MLFELDLSVERLVQQVGILIGAAARRMDDYVITLMNQLVLLQEFYKFLYFG